MWHQELWDPRVLASGPRGHNNDYFLFCSSPLVFPLSRVQLSSPLPKWGYRSTRPQIDCCSLKYSQFTTLLFEQLLPFLPGKIINSFKADSDFVFISSVPNVVPTYNEYAINIHWKINLRIFNHKLGNSPDGKYENKGKLLKPGEIERHLWMVIM